MVLGDAVLGPLATETTLLDTAKRRRNVRDDARVDAYHANLEALRDAVHTLQIAREEVAGQANIRLVGHGDNVGLGLEWKQARQGTKRLLRGNGHVDRHVAEDGGLEKVATEVGQRLAAYQELGALGDGIVDVLLDLVDGAVVDQRAMGHALFEAVADLEALDLFDKLGRKLVVDAALHVDAVGAHARLARRAELGGNGAGDGGIKLGVVKDNKGRVAAELERELLQGAGGLAHEELADAGGAGERDLLDNGRGGEFLADSRRVFERGDDVDDTLGDTGAVRQLSKGQSREGSLAGGLADYGAAGSQSGTNLSRNHGGGEVPAILIVSMPTSTCP